MSIYGILSLNIYEKDNNWGSVLQSYALQKFVNKLGHEAMIVDICPDFINEYEAKYPIVRCFSLGVGYVYHSFVNSIINAPTYIRRAKKFNDFINGYYYKTIKLNKYSLEEQKFDGFIVGSDIVWNIDFTNGFDDLYFCNLSFMKEKNNIAYAPSMFDRLFTSDEEKIFRKRLENFKYISVREQTYAHYVQRYTDTKVIDVIDPTLLLEGSDYKCFLREPIIKEKYILVYTVPCDEALERYAYEYSLKKGFKVVRIECLDIRWKKHAYISFNDAGIEEWLTLIKNSEMVFTNSFHACVFSVLFKKQFQVVYRNPGKEKIKDFCEKLGISNFSEKSSEYFFDVENEINYENVYEKLEVERRKSRKFLNKALRRGKDEN